MSKRIATMGITCLDDRLFQSAGPIELNKPRYGLYGSTIYIDEWTGNKTTGWLNWCINEEFHTDKYFKGISYTLHKKAKVYTVNNYEDYLWLLNYYGKPDYWDEKITIDFDKLKLDYDAFHLTEEGFYELRMIYENDIINGKEYRVDDFYSYDCETWIMFNLECINKGSIQNICLKYKED